MKNAPVQQLHLYTSRINKRPNTLNTIKSFYYEGLWRPLTLKMMSEQIRGFPELMRIYKGVPAYDCDIENT